MKAEFPPLHGDETTSDLVDRALRLAAAPLLDLVRAVPAELVAGGTWTWDRVERTGLVRWRSDRDEDVVHAHDPSVLIKWIDRTWDRGLWSDALGSNIDRARISQLLDVRNAHAHNYYEREENPFTDAEARDGLRIVAEILDRLAATDVSASAGAQAPYAWGLHDAVGRRTSQAPQRRRWAGLKSRPPRAGTHTFGLHWVEPTSSDRSPGAWWLVHIEPHGEISGEFGPHSTNRVIDYLGQFSRSDKVIGGCAFCFSTPKWYAEALSANTGCGPREAVWQVVTEATGRHEDSAEVANVLNAAVGNADSPFWLGSLNMRDPNRASGIEAWRQTETKVDAETEATPSSIFRIGGEASVGALAVWGIPVLQRIASLGFAVWPFDEPGTKTVVEIFPRSLWAATQSAAPVRSTPDDRGRFLEQQQRYVPGGESRDTLERHRRAFDAFYTAWALREFGGNLAAGGALGSPWGIEGRIWLPSPKGRAG